MSSFGGESRGAVSFAQWCEDGDVASDVGSAVSGYGVWASSRNSAASFGPMPSSSCLKNTYA